MKSGLDDVVAAETRLSDVDGANGVLTICGYTLDTLVAGFTYEDVLAMLLEGFAPAADLAARLAQARAAVFPQLAAADASLLALGPVEALRALMARLPDGEDFDTALRLAAAPAVFTPGLLRLRQGLSPIAPDTALGHAADMLQMLTGIAPPPVMARALDTYLVTVSDHGLNASTFAARVVASTRAGFTSSVLAALGALKGPLHGGAPGPVLDMLDAIATPDRAEAFLSAELAAGRRLMGFGHRVYRVRDPRADALKGALDAMALAGVMPSPARRALAETVEATALSLLKKAKPDRVLQTNVEFYTAVLLETLGFPRDAFTCVFAAGRVGGWLAHAREQIDTGRLIRPQSLYVGPRPQLPPTARAS